MAEMNETQQPTGQPGGETSAEQDAGAQGGGTGGQISKDARTWAMFCHLSALAGLLPIVPVLGCVIAPLVIWQIKKDEFTFVDEQGKEAVNFQISILICAFIAIPLCLVCIGAFLLPAVYIFDLIFLLIAGIKANNGEHYRYPLSIRFIK